MEILYENKYGVISFDKKRSFIKMVRLAETKHMSEKEYKETMLKLRDSVIVKKAKYALLDNRELHFVVRPKLQDWANIEIVAPAFKNSLERVAFVEGEDLFANISSQQTMEDNDKTKKPFRYFNNENKAMEWLIHQ